MQNIDGRLTVRVFSLQGSDQVMAEHPDRKNDQEEDFSRVDRK
jgi:hypothetical protein